MLCGACGQRALSLDAGSPANDGAVRDAVVDQARRVDGPPVALDGPSGPRAGLILLLEVTDAASTAQQGAVFAIFTPAPHPFFTPLKRIDDKCGVFGGDDTGPLQLSAGRVTISGAPYPIRLDPEPNPKPNQYLYAGVLYPELFSASTILTIEASGGQYLPFRGRLSGVSQPKVSWPDGTLTRSRSYELAPGAATGFHWLIIRPAAGATFVRCEDKSGAPLRLEPKHLAALPTTTKKVKLAVGLARSTVLVKGPPPTKTMLYAVHLVERVYSLAP